MNLSDIKLLAHSAHAGQFRRDGVTPYIRHVEDVARRVRHEGDPFNEKVAWLHDVVEDTDYTPDSLLEAGVERDVVEILSILTHTRGQSYEDYIARISQYPNASCVKIADILSNLSDSPTEKQIVKYAKALLQLNGR